MKSTLTLLILALLPLAAQAQTAKCRIESAKPGSALAPFAGGKARIELGTGITTLFHGGSGEAYELISATRVSTHGADRAACNFAWEKLVSGETLLVMLHKFNNCAHRNATDPSLTGYIRAEVSFDLRDGSGFYREIFLTPTGVPPTAHATLSSCRLE